MGGYSLFYDYYCRAASHHTHTRGNTAHLIESPIFGKRRPQSYSNTRKLRQSKYVVFKSLEYHTSLSNTLARRPENFCDNSSARCNLFCHFKKKSREVEKKKSRPDEGLKKVRNYCFFLAWSGKGREFRFW